jgi:hypothetical protein
MINERAVFFFLPLVAALASDEAAECRTAGACVIDVIVLDVAILCDV